MNRIKTTKYLLVTFLLTCIFLLVFDTTGHARSRGRHHGYYGFLSDLQQRSPRAFKKLDRSDRINRREYKDRNDYKFDGDVDQPPDQSGPVKSRFGPDRPAPSYSFMAE
jgi:hypothetical protein